MSRRERLMPPFALLKGAGTFASNLAHDETLPWTENIEPGAVPLSRGTGRVLGRTPDI